MADKAAERIKFETELLRLTWLTVIATIGGSVSVLLGGVTPLRLILAGAGFVVTLVLTVVGWRFNRRITAHIEQIPEEP